jgi:hypothetical protein
MLLLVGLDLVPPPWMWDADELAIHTFHRAVLAFTTSAAHDALRAP